MSAGLAGGRGGRAAEGARWSRTPQLEGIGRFGWVTDPEGNRVELWQPA